LNNVLTLVPILSDAEINELLTDTQAFQDFFLSLEQVRSMTAVSKELQEGNEQLARKTLGREAELRTLQEEVGEKIKAMKLAKEELNRKEREREDVLAVSLLEC
jgi:ESCRT-I complex subunit VPS37